MSQEVKSEVLFQGTLRERPLADVFELLFHQELTGLLVLERWKVSVRIEVCEGKILHVTEKPLSSVGTLGEMLLHLQVVTPAQIEQALEQQKRTMQPLGEILQRLFSCPRESIALALRVQAIELLYNLFFWKDAKYRFERLDHLSPSLFAPIEIQAFLADVAPVLNAWPTLRKTLYSSNMQIRCDEDRLQLMQKAELSPLSRDILELLAEPQTFRALAILTGEGQYLVGRELMKLKHEEYIHIEPPPRQKRQYAQMILGSSLQSFFVWLVMSAFLIALGTFLFFFAAYSPFQSFYFGAAQDPSKSTWRTVFHENKLRKIRYALDTFRKLRGHYPKRLSELAKLGLVSPETLRCIGDNLYFYQRSGETYFLSVTLF